MIRILLAILLLATSAGSARAQFGSLLQTRPATPPAHATAAPAPGAITPDQARQALDMLQDDAKRAAFVATLQTIAKATPATTPTPASAAPKIAIGALPIPLAPDSLGAEILVTAEQRITGLSVDVLAMVRTVTDFPLLAHWLEQFATDPVAQAALMDAAWKLLVVMACALAVERLLAIALRRPARALEAHAPHGDTLPGDPSDLASGDLGASVEEAAVSHTQRRRPSPLALLRRLPFVLACLVLNLLPVLAVAAVGYALLGTGLADQSTTRLVILAVLNAYVLLRVVTSVTRAMVAPDSPRMRMLHLSDEDAAYTLRWVRRIASVAIFGYAGTEVALLFGLYQLSHDALLKLIMLVVHVMLVIVVIQKREVVAERLRAPKKRTGVISALRNRAAKTWHIMAIFYIVALWLVWAFEVPNGFSRLLHFFVSTFLILTASRLAAIALLSGVDRTLRITPALSARYPGLEARAQNYHPIARAAVIALVTAVAFVSLFEAWGIDALSWFEFGALGGRLVSALAVMGVTILLSLLVWEVSNAGIQRHLDRLDRGAQIAKSARLRTLLPMLRTTLLVLILVVAGLMVLSEIGVNIAPLLAGASVIGIAVGFGSQKLVQDVITGLFLLLENTMQVGDVVTLGGLTGTVENLSVRTIRLRAQDGAVHMVPFSAVTTVTNMTRDFSYAVLDISVGLNEEPDHIIEILRGVASDMRGEMKWEAALRDDLDVLGVEKFIDTAWVLRVRIKTLPAQRWAVGRELNRRIKYRFDELAIESPITSYRVLSTVPAPPPAVVEAAPVVRREPRMTAIEPILSESLRDDGFAFLHAGESRAWLEGSGAIGDWEEFAASWDGMPLDTYMADGGKYRRRRHAVFKASAGEADMVRQPDQPHFQTLDYNALNGGVERWFEPMTPATAASDTMLTILAATRELFDGLAPDADWHIELHQFRIEANEGAAGPADARRPSPRRGGFRAGALDLAREHRQRDHHHPRQPACGIGQLHVDGTARRGAGGRPSGIAWRDRRPAARSGTPGA